MNLDYTHFPAIPDLLPILVIPPPQPEKKRKREKSSVCVSQLKHDQIPGGQLLKGNSPSPPAPPPEATKCRELPQNNPGRDFTPFSR